MVGKQLSDFKFQEGELPEGLPKVPDVTKQNMQSYLNRIEDTTRHILTLIALLAVGVGRLYN